MTVLSLLVCLLLGFSVHGNPLPSEDLHFDLYFHHDEVARHVRNGDGEYATERALMRRLDDHFRANESIHELRTRDLQNKELNSRATVFYKPNLNAVCRQNGLLQAHPTAIRNPCVSPRQFSVDCDPDPPGDYVLTVHGYCQTNYFCVTVLKDTLQIIDPDNIQLGQAVEPICQKTVYFKPFQITKSLVDFTTDWWTAPGKFKVAFGRMALLVDTAGVDYKLKFEYKVTTSVLWSVAGTKSIERENTGADHEYELSYNYDGVDNMQFRAGTTDLNSISGATNLILNVYFGAAS
ncbi:hypothetical protein ACJQWK_08043 [Exserohilum turcicum]|uniref:Uncharacterized protein n=1 Tax=Exserohilum turcicum (strain 28A) TaxID=671987 RepID=R0J104_EXST2|nr:uncharacterized protein SETTUDRAFT_37095 [Exserohilum turcica Et28A]EOA90456.1 hypothetical protein SETTUDRAFT_37095 [Exserohilum turcica Et28A]